MIVLLLIALGLVQGSFVNALVWRIHLQMKMSTSQKVKQKLTSKRRSRLYNFKNLQHTTRQNRYSILTGRSMCPKCEHELAPADLIPVTSWLWLKGKCRYCRQPISWQYPLVELLTAGLFVLSYAYWPVALEGYGLVSFIYWLLFLVGFMALAVFDMRWFLLPNRIVYPLIILAVLQVSLHVTVFRGGGPVVMSAAYGVLFVSGLFYAIYAVGQRMQRQLIGLGDAKLGIVLGLLVGGPWEGLLLLFISSLLGTLVSLPLLVGGRASRTTLIPYGPFLLAATIVLQLWGMPIVGWLQRLLIV